MAAGTTRGKVRSAGRGLGFVVVTLVLVFVLAITGYFLLLGFLWSQ